MKKLITLISVLTTVCCIFTGCTTETNLDNGQPYNIACVLGITNNNPIVHAAEIEEIANLSSLPGSTYCCILASSKPDIICAGEIPSFKEKGYTKTMLERIETSIQLDINTKIDTAVPSSPDVDIAAATSLGIRTLHSNKIEGRKNLLVYYLSGISTSGVIDMTTTPICELDVETSVNELVNHLNWDMNGIDVIWYCCGDIAGEQAVLSDTEKQTLMSFYEKLFRAMGASSVSFIDNIPPSGSYNFNQPVGVMKTEGTKSLLQTKVIESQEVTSEEKVEEIFADGDVLSFSNETITFQPNSTELADPEAASKALTYVIDYMSNNPDFDLLIASTTTSAGEEDSCRTFSEKRGNSVREILITEGINPDRIHVIGLGYSSEFYIPDRNTDGTLNENVAVQNRTVKLLDMKSETANRILNTK